MSEGAADKQSERTDRRSSSSPRPTAILFHYEGGASKKRKGGRAENEERRRRREVFVEGERISGGQGSGLFKCASVVKNMVLRLREPAPDHAFQLQGLNQLRVIKSRGKVYVNHVDVTIVARPEGFRRCAEVDRTMT